MKKLIYGLCLLVCSTGLFAQGIQEKSAAKMGTSTATTQTTTKTPTATTTTSNPQKPAANPAAYACPKCYAITKDGGNCTKCNVAKVQLGTYYCEHCMKSCGAKPGKCASCGMASTQMTRKMCAAKTTGPGGKPKTPGK